MEGAHSTTISNCVAVQDFDDANEDQIKWNRSHDFSQLHQENFELISASDTEEKCESALEL